MPELTTDFFDAGQHAVWTTELAFLKMQQAGLADTKRTAERRLHELALLPPELNAATLRDEKGRQPTSTVLDWEIAQARSQRKLVLFAQLHTLPGGRPWLHANDARGARYWLPFSQTIDAPATLNDALHQLRQHLAKDMVVFPHGELVGYCRGAKAPLAISLLAYPAVLRPGAQKAGLSGIKASTPYLRQLEAESIHIMREAVAEAENPVMLYSVGKDSSVMLHLARKAFYPSKPPFALMHVDTRWKFQDMYCSGSHRARVGYGADRPHQPGRHQPRHQPF
jgi:sulfate adenylyltransferase subunit 2